MKYVSIHLIAYTADIQSESDETKRYRVTYGYPLTNHRLTHDNMMALTGSKRYWVCECPSWIHKHAARNTHCKHILKAIETPPENGGFCDWRGELSECIINGNLIFAPYRDNMSLTIPCIPEEVLEKGYYYDELHGLFFVPSREAL